MTTTAKSFASQGDLEEKKATFTELADGAYAYTTEGDPNSGVIVGDDAVMVVDARATPVLARELVERIRAVTDKPIRYVVLTHYHAVRVLGASAYGAGHVVASRGTYELIRERGEADFKSEAQRFPRLFRAIETVPGLTWPNLVFDERITLFLGKREVEIRHLGRGHTKGDTIAWLPKERVLFSGDLVEYGATPYAGDAYFNDWPATLERLSALRPEKLVPGRGDALTSAATSAEAIAVTREFVETMLREVKRAVAAKKSLKATFDGVHAMMEPRYRQWVIFEHCLPFDVSRAYDEASGIADPRVWTAERDLEMWSALQAAPPS
jgi:glyoxylase-like metal-dependent hydrolase (beta-lactamase superfamily II)